ncbi:MAG TPA: hypothetical protein VF000_02005 [Agromyces sp.]|jgi:hypothetical protein
MTDEPRQRIERAPGKARRARLTPAPGSDPAPEAPIHDGEDDRDSTSPAKGVPSAASDDDRLTRDRPPHWRQT